jgi:hypothetical protein
MTDAQPLSNATDAPDALSFDAWVQGLFMAPSKNLGGRPRGSLSRTVRSAYNLRAPEPGETELSASEIQHGIATGVLEFDDEKTDQWPMIRLHIGPDQWGIKAVGMKRAGPFDGLTA